MDLEAALQLADAAIVAKTRRHLKDIEIILFRGSWQGLNYEEIASANGYTVNYLKQDIGPKFWQLLSYALGEKVSKTNFQAALERKAGIDSRGKWSLGERQGGGDTESINYLTPIQNRVDWGEVIDVLLDSQRNRGILESTRDSLPGKVTKNLSHPYYWSPFILIGNGL